MPKKILYVISHISTFWSHRAALIQDAQKKGYEVIICAPGADKDARLKEYNIKAYGLNKIYGPVCVWRAVQKINKIIKAERPDILHAITLKQAFLCGLAARNRDTKVIYLIAGLGYLFRGEGLRARVLRTLVTPFLKYALMAKNTKIIFQNPDDQEIMIVQGFVKQEQAHLIRGSGVDLDAFTASDLSRAQIDNPVIVFPTRLIWEKGIRIFIEAAQILDHEGFKARYVLAGGLYKENPNAVKEAELTALLKDSPVQWRGHVEDMPGLLSQASLIAYPSWYGEGVPKVLLEAAASGRAIITTDHPGCREAVKDGENGVLIPVKDPFALADEIENLLSDEARLRDMGRASRKIAEEEFDVRQINQRTLALYED